MLGCALSRLGLAAALAAAPVACATGPAPASSSSPAVNAASRSTPSRMQVRDRDRALVAGLATSLALGLVGLGTLLANANLATPHERGTPSEMPATMAIAGGVMSLGFLTAIPLGVAVERHRARYPEFFGKKLPRPSASLRPSTPLRP